jgi:succinoglycan biosynthesis protein ExoA
MSGEVLIVVPCLNEEAHLPDLLQQLRRDNPGAMIVVADGGSTDGSRQIVARLGADDPQLVLMDNPDRIQSAGINRAVAQFGDCHTWLARIDAHCAYPAGYVERLVAAGIAREAVSVVVPMFTEGKSCFQKAAAAAQNSVIGTGGSAHRSQGAGTYVDHGHHALMRIDAFQASGGYNLAMSHNEDAELDHRLGRLGKIWLEPACTITYYPRATASALWRQYRNYGKGRAQTLQLHRMRPKLRQMVPLLVPIAVILSLIAPFFPIFALPLLGWAVLSITAGALIGWRLRSACAALSGLAAMIMHMAWGFGFLGQITFGRPPAPAIPINA